MDDKTAKLNELKSEIDSLAEEIVSSGRKGALTDDQVLRTTTSVMETRLQIAILEELMEISSKIDESSTKAR